MNRLRNFLPLMAVLIGAVILGAPTQARADFKIRLTDSSGTVDVFFAPGSGPGPQSGVFTGLSPNLEFSIILSAGIVTESAAQTELNIITLRVERLKAGTGTLKLELGANKLTLPPGTALDWFSGAGGTYTPQPGVPPFPPGSVGLTFQSYGDAGNVLMGTSQTLGLQAAVPPSSTSPSTFDTGEAIGQFTRGPGDFSLMSAITLTMTNSVDAIPLVLSGSIVGFQGHNIVSAVPAPAGLLLMFSGIPALAVTWLRRRKVKLDNA